MLCLALAELALQNLLDFFELGKLARKLLEDYIGWSFSSETAKFTFIEFAVVMGIGLPQDEG